MSTHHLFRVLVFSFSLLIPISTLAAYNSNISGVLQGVYVYSDGDYIYFRFEDQPSSHPGCNPTYFVIHGSVPENRRNAMLSRLLTAYAMKESVNIGYDAQGDCSNGYIRVHRVG